MRVLLLVCILSLLASSAAAEELLFKNGDRITAEIISETEETITVDSVLFGSVTINKNLLVQDEPEAPGAEEESDWTRKVTLGYSQSGGNTEKSQFSGDVAVEKITGDKEYSGKYSAYVSSSDNAQDAREFKAVVRYANKFGSRKQWYNFYKVEGDQDRFSNIDYRITPSVGYGYWFYNRDDLKLKAETAVGFEYTNYADNSDSDGEVVIVPQAYFEKELQEGLRLTEELTLYPSLEETSKIRLTSETSLTGKITDNTAWKFSFIDDYNSEPKGAAEKNDYKLISSLEYSF